LESTPVPQEVLEIARFLRFFARARIYWPIDRLAGAFSFDDVVRTLENALRQAKVALDSAEIITDESGKTRRVVRVRDQYIPAPWIPSEKVVKTFYELCKKDLLYAKIAASLALALPEISQKEASRLEEVN